MLNIDGPGFGYGMGGYGDGTAVMFNVFINHNFPCRYQAASAMTISGTITASVTLTPTWRLCYIVSSCSKIDNSLLHVFYKFWYGSVYSIWEKIIVTTMIINTVIK